MISSVFSVKSATYKHAQATYHKNTYSYDNKIYTAERNYLIMPSTKAAEGEVLLK